MEITIDVDVLLKHNLSLSEYVYLKSIYEDRSKAEMLKIYSCIDRIEEDSLQDRGFLKILVDNEVTLRDKGLKLFESKNLFHTYIATFPIKTPCGRYLSPAGLVGIKVEKLEAKWKKHFKNKPHKEQRAIEVLEAEIKWRRDTHQLKFMHNAEAWLNQGDYQNFEYLLEEVSEVNKKTFNDMM